MEADDAKRGVKRKLEGDELPLDALLDFFYSRLFPYKQMGQWLMYGDEGKNSQFSRREFCFTLKDDVFVRYKSFTSPAELQKELRKEKPEKIDLGAVYNMSPKDHKTVTASSFVPLEKEVVFDIDMTDYDQTRTCCEGGNVCMKCWPFMTVVIKILDRALREDFGFQNLLWVYSGRRGVHCWVCDTRARQLDQAARSAVAEYLSVQKEKGKKLLLTTPLHPSLEVAYQVLRPYFVEVVLVNQKWYDETGAKFGTILAELADDPIKPDILAYVETNRKKGAEFVWKMITNTIEKNGGPKIKKSLVEIVFAFLYPRLDINVSKGLNHLLKSPFCVHPKTGRVCVPIDPSEADQFNPTTVPTVQLLLSEIHEADARPAAPEDMDEDGKLSDYKKTSLSPYIKYFEREFLKPLHAALRRERADPESF